MPRTVLGWRCRWGPGCSLPTSYTSPRATNKPLIVFPIHTDRGHHCLSSFTPCLSCGPWFTPFENYWYSSVSFTQFVVPWTQHGRVVMSARNTFFMFFSECCTYILIFLKCVYLYYIQVHRNPGIFSLRTGRQCGNLPNVTDLGRCITVHVFFFSSSYKNTGSSSHLQVFVPVDTCWSWIVKRPDVVNMLQAPAAVSPATAWRKGSVTPSPAELYTHPHGEEPCPSRPDLAWPPCPEERQSNVPATP